MKYDKNEEKEKQKGYYIHILENNSDGKCLVIYFNKDNNEVKTFNMVING